ncbi:hypothetical protein [Thermocrispum municipale]|jgi:hypothetical protein|uniref:hypothetical protein n=1 Tax=Thermocrispum municipale TaxID=37926 RepID=UPI000401D697|nr:hypothetical protein [Thermocrispum municipale]
MTAQSDPISDRLVELIDRGFQFLHPTNAEGQVQAVVGVRVHSQVIDLVQIHAEDDVTATRMPVGEQDIMEPRTVLWQTHGEVTGVLDAMLALPEETPDSAESRGCWVPVRPGDTRFIRS